MAAIIAQGGFNESPKLLEQYNSNLQAAVNRITRVLSDVNSVILDDATVQDIKRAARMASELGLQFGVQPSRLQLSRPEWRQVVVIGKEFHDCINADKSPGSKVGVDLVVCPGLNRIGDGKGDMSTRLCLLPCEVYPLPA
jgi:hypothetical protein